MKPGNYYCSKCGKKLIQRTKNGLYIFIFGGPKGGKNPKVKMLIHGNIKMKCLRTTCVNKYPDHWNTFTLFPNVGVKGDNQDCPGVDPAFKPKRTRR